MISKSLRSSSLAPSNAEGSKDSERVFSNLLERSQRCSEFFLARRRETEDLFPDLARFHTEIDRRKRRRASKPLQHLAVHPYTQGLKIAEFPIRAYHLLASQQPCFGEALPHRALQARRLAQYSQAQPGHPPTVHRGKDPFHQSAVIVLPAEIFDHRIKMKSQFVARLLAPARRLDTFLHGRRQVFVRGHDRLRIHGPGNYYPFLGVQVEESINPVAFGFKLQQHVGLIRKERNDFPAKTDVGLKRQTVGDFTRADAEKKAPVAAQELIRFVD